MQPSYHAILAVPFDRKTAPAFSALPPSLAVAWPKLGVSMQGAALSSLDFVSPELDDLPAVNTHAADVVRQLTAYFSDPDYRFTIPLVCVGTPFQQRVWRLLCEIPRGQPQRYGDLAKRLASGPRAVGGACRANPVPIVVPCHRVVSSTGLGGYSGVTTGFSPELAIKRWLLDHERG